MNRRLPRSGATPALAELPPLGLSGLDPAFSRLLTVRESDGIDTVRTWHVLDNGPELAALGVTPVGTILCVHGNPTWSYLWRRLVTQATDAATRGAEAWRVVAVDQLDMGFSERTGVPRTLARRVLDLADLTDSLAIEGPVVTLGHDWGGSISLGWALDHPGQLAGVMLLNTAVHQPEQHSVPAPLRLALGKGILGVATVVTPAFLETTLALAHPSLDASVKTGYRAPYRGKARRGGIGAFVADIPVDAQHESAPELDRIAAGLLALEVPALLLWGPRDPIFSDRYLDDLLGRMPHADVHRFEGCGHLLAEDADYAGAALTWLGDLPAHGAGAPSGHGAENAPEATSSVVEPAVPASPWAATTVNPLWHYLDELRSSDETALVDMAPGAGASPRVVTWRQLSRQVRRIATGLDRIGVRRGDRVSLLVPPGADLTAVLYACVRIGAIVVVADAGLGLRGLTRAVRGARPDFVIGAVQGLAAARALGWPGTKIATARFPAAVARALGVRHTLAELIELGADEALPDEPGPDDTAAVLFTSGSTGPAKGVVYSHGQLSAVANALFMQYGVGVGTGLVAGFAPFALLGPALGARSVTPDMDVTSPKTLTAVAVAAAVGAIDATVVFLSPAALANVVATADDLVPADHDALRGVRTFLSAGAPVSEPLLAAAARLMPEASAHTPYGMTEGLLMADISLEGIRAASEVDALAAAGPGGVCVGIEAGAVSIRISALDAQGNATGAAGAEANVTGEIVVSAPHVKDHYDRLWLADRASRRAVPADERRWHRTGDVGHLDGAGRLWVEGRLPHVIVTIAGVVTPVGPEQRIESVPTVSRAAVVGVGEPGTQQLVAVVETSPGARRPGLAAESLATAVRASVMVPIAAILVVPHLPTDIRHNSKIDRTLLSHWAAGILGGGRMTQP
ncbi:alpha/beta fold hydrolase [Cryobacterium psychrophilum]|uniref:Alpha/beta fold hydrolase n=1 Tax=Cryobacterium psychrophilum TaxID=41988 RepID=A0A4Y8KL27_9MICO|nr:alpha/beta fold hydrolase [Cryobacterium psychrophilum]TDW30301.1 acyl-CoA synthetase (AMP-forming)/AMP-acid ligase II [Cryobacterium psychrophilum]TFD77516.1 alpha/beta fold hydrolase [Cryobacterium psychrophilum]